MSAVISRYQTSKSLKGALASALKQRFVANERHSFQSFLLITATKKGASIAKGDQAIVANETRHEDRVLGSMRKESEDLVFILVGKRLDFQRLSRG
jgi:hypothetical protein